MTENRRQHAEKRNRSIDYSIVDMVNSCLLLRARSTQGAGL
jgi:hypothetical protein